MAEMFDPSTGEVTQTYRRSAECGDLFAALAKAQAKFGNAEKAGTNPHFQSGYATLETVMEATREGRAENNLAVLQMPGNYGTNITVTTLLGHPSGQWIESTIYVAPGKFDAQGAGSVITYLRRYALMAVLGIAPEDDDGNAAVARPEPVSRPASRPPARGAPSKINPAVAVPNGDEVEAKKAFMRVRDAIKDAVTETECRMIYDGLLEEWGERYGADIDLVSRVNGNAVSDLKGRVENRILAVRSEQAALRSEQAALRS